MDRLHPRKAALGLMVAGLLVPALAHAQADSGASEADATAASQRGRFTLEELVVTATRSEAMRGNIAQQMELVSLTDIESTPASFVTDSLKKNASVDVIQYPGGLSGVGMRGFRPQFSGINQQVLVLVDGRPAGATSLGNLPQSGIERIEVVKGSSSSVYGASAMGGVINVITRKSQDDIDGEAYARFGSYETLQAGVRAGGRLSETLDFDISLDERSQYDDFDVGDDAVVFNNDLVLGDGATRPFTSFQTRSAYARLGADLGDNWRADVRFMGFRGRGLEGPGAESNGTSRQSTNDKDVAGIDARVLGEFERHTLQLVAFSTREENERREAVNGVVDLRGTGNETEWWGLQVSDTYQLNETLSLVAGVDYEAIDRVNVGFASDGGPRAPFAPNEERETLGLYADLTAQLLDGRLVLNGGVRYDEIESSLVETPLRPDFVPDSTTTSTTNPRAGVVFYPFADRRIRLHASVGQGFVVPSVRQVAGSTESVANGQLRVQRGNPDLDPESSVSTDLGVGYSGDTWGADLTWFRTDVDDKIESIELINTSDLRESTFVNASSALAQGIELSLQGQLPSEAMTLTGGSLTYNLSSTYYTDREQDLPSGPAPLRNVARMKLTASLDYVRDGLNVRIGVRHVSGMIDRDFSRERIFTDGQGGAFTYPDITVLDLTASYDLTDRQTIGLQVENLADEYYYEKNDYPMQGRLLLATYRMRF